MNTKEKQFRTGFSFVIAAVVAFLLTPVILQYWTRALGLDSLRDVILDYAYRARVSLWATAAFQFLVGLIILCLPKTKPALRFAPPPWILATGYALTIIGLSYLGPVIALRRLIFGTLILHLVYLFRSKIPRFSSLSHYGKVTYGFLAAFTLCRAIPGAYLPPFHNGISGWVLDVKKNPVVVLSGFKLRHRNGKSIWFSNAFTSPQNFISIQFREATKGDPRLRSEVVAYYMELYRRAYPDLLMGRYPNQKLLRQFAYPGHNSYQMLDYRDFPPSDIIRFEKIEEMYNRETKRKLETHVLWSVDLNADGNI